MVVLGVRAGHDVAGNLVRVGGNNFFRLPFSLRGVSGQGLLAIHIGIIVDVLQFLFAFQEELVLGFILGVVVALPVVGVADLGINGVVRVPRVAVVVVVVVMMFSFWFFWEGGFLFFPFPPLVKNKIISLS